MQLEIPFLNIQAVVMLLKCSMSDMLNKYVGLECKVSASTFDFVMFFSLFLEHRRADEENQFS